MSTADESSLIEALQHNKTVSGGQTLETRMADLAVWYHYHRKEATDPIKKLAIVEKVLWIQMEINALLLERIRKLKSGGELWLPSGMVATGDDARKFG